ncbi:cadherin-like domain-containing protein, partial [Oleiphilus sp. HI0067]
MSDIPNDENNPLNDAVENSVTPEANSENGSSGSNNQQSTTTNTAATGADTVNSQITEAEQDLSGSNTEGESADEGVASGGEEEASPDAVQSSDAQSNIVDSQLESDEPSDGEDAAGLSEEATANALQAVGIQSVGGNDIAAALQNPDFAQAAQGIAQDLLDSNISVDDALTQLEEALNDNDPDSETTTESFDVIVEEATDQVAAEGEDFDTKTVSETFQMDVTSVNDDPDVGSTIELTMQEDDSLLVTQQVLLANSSDVDGDTLTALNLQTANPELTITDNGDGTFTLTPAANFNGDLDISFDVFDGEATVAANIDLTVNPVNDLPVAQDQNFQMNEDGTITLTDGDLLTGASDVDGDTLSISDVTYTGTDGIFTDNGDDTYTFAPNENFNGNVTVDFTVSDGQGGTDTAQANIVVVPVNDPPVSGNLAYAIDEDGSITLSQ